MARGRGAAGSDTVALPVALAVLVVAITVVAIVLVCAWWRRRRSARELDRAVHDARQERLEHFEATSGGVANADGVPWGDDENDKSTPFWRRVFKRGTGAGGGAGGRTLSEELARRKSDRRKKRRKLRKEAGKQPHWWRAAVAESTSSSSDDSDAEASPWDGKVRAATNFLTVGSYLPSPLKKKKAAEQAEARRLQREAERKRWFRRMQFWKSSDDEEDLPEHSKRKVVKGTFPSPASPHGQQAGYAPPAVEVVADAQLDVREFTSLRLPKRAGHALHALRRELPAVTQRRGTSIEEVDEVTERRLRSQFDGVAPFEGATFRRKRRLSSSSTPSSSSSDTSSAAVPRNDASVVLLGGSLMPTDGHLEVVPGYDPPARYGSDDPDL